MRIEAFLLVVASGAGASPFVVTTSLDTVDALAGDGLCADAQGACSLRAAVQESNAWPGADAIRAPAGTYMLTNAGALEDFAATGDLDIAGPVEIVGAGASLTIVDGNSLDTVFEFHPATVAAGLHALTVRGGIGATPCSQGDCRSAGGIVNRPGVALRLRDVELRENRAGGLVSSGNSAMQAGALFANNAEVELRRSLVAGNHSVQGAALVFNFGNEVLIENVTIAGNQGGSGAILNDGWSDLRIRHATITGNSGGNSGGIHDVHGGFGQVILSNTLLTGNHAAQAAQDDCNGWLVSAGGTLVGTEVGAGTQPGLPC
jgi:CSLREA domain-containing protein